VKLRKWFPAYFKARRLPERRTWRGLEAWLLPLWRYSPRTVMFVYAVWKAYLAPLPREFRFRGNLSARFLDTIERHRGPAAAAVAEHEGRVAEARRKALLREAHQQRDGSRLRDHVAATLRRFIDRIGATGGELSVEIGDLEDPRIRAYEATRIFLRHRGRLIVQMNPVVSNPWDVPGTEGVLWASYDDDSLARLIGIEPKGPEPYVNPRSVLMEIAVYVARVVNDIAIKPGRLDKSPPKLRPSTSHAPSVPQTGPTQ
jgi:hypothetical protein